MSSFTKSALVSQLASETGLRRVDAANALGAILSGIKHGLTNDGKVSLVGFGTFAVRDRPARIGHSPQTHQPIEIPASKGIKFKPSQALRDAVNG